MTKKDIAELKRRLKKEECTFTRLCGAYVDSNKQIVVKMNETFLNLEAEEFYKYLEIAKKTLSGTVGNNLLNLEFPMSEEEAGGRQQFLMGLKSSDFKNEELLDRFYEMVIGNYDYVGNYLILLFHDAYDVMTKTTDNSKLDESEEVYEYILCAICPVALSKPGLGYLKDENRIGPRIRDWVVCPPDNGFIFPAFSDRSADIHSLIYYARDAKEPHAEFMGAGLGCDPKRTATEQKVAFHSIIKNAIGDDEEDSAEIMMNIQESISHLVEDHEDEVFEETAPVVVTKDALPSLMTEINIPETVIRKIEESYEEEFGDTPPAAEYLIDTKALAANAEKKKALVLEKEVETLKQQLEETKTAEISEDTIETYDVVLRVRPQKVTQIKSEIIDGQKCLIIPLDEDESANVNGELL